MYQIEEKRQQVLDFVNGLHDEDARTKPDEHTWSILETLEHLYLIEGWVTQQLKEALAKEEVQEVREKPVGRTVDRSHKMDVPDSLRPKGQFDSIEEATDSLAKTRDSLLFLIRNYDQEQLQKRALPHPAFGKMNLEQWVEFIGFHELRHLEQMKEVKNAL
ncbi:DinB superfamily protein [Thalassobacillus cyri]|uniref:DinB superfamily protein n=1 Tax=Thalassobacillus cyri TaxID=571932 RepID=A0A1H3Z636_9BACI|nr:DinB family protein [Thalassobacillus cyri]SEA19156.1 DinB superfamily protein [Thalassobacillus cyri]